MRTRSRDKQRELTLWRRTDVSGTLAGDRTAELCELLEAHFDALAKTAPGDQRDQGPRSAGQRRHDALLEAMRLNLRAQQLPAIAGVTATLVLTMTAQAYLTGRGLARTGHGALLPARDAIRWAGGDYRLRNVVLDRTQAITGYRSIERLFSETQRLALAAVEGGCSFPNCPTPTPWCEIDHTTNHTAGGPTRLDHGLVACRQHNNHAKHHGWRSTRIHGRAAWIPPHWIDPEQKPQHKLPAQPRPSAVTQPRAHARRKINGTGSARSVPEKPSSRPRQRETRLP